tara:strand:- start:1650 stop:1862 length:213 start_codon:yes stop_codon:yes gene_type:complete
MDEKAKIFKHLQDRLSSVSREKDKGLHKDLGILEKHVALTRVFLTAEKKYLAAKSKKGAPSGKVDKNCDR